MASNPLLRQSGASPLRILLVEDDADDAALMHAYLAEAAGEGADVLHVRNLGDALRVLRSQVIHLTLLDLDLPDSLGFQTLERMRAAAAGPIIVVSGNGHPSLVDEVLKRRAYDVIPKQELDAATLRRILRLASVQQETGRALRATEGRFRALLENSAEAVALLDAGGRIEYASASIRRVLGFESHEFAGRICLEFVHPEDRGAVHAAFRRLHGVPGARETLRVRYPHKDGSLRLLESTAVNRLADPDVAAIVCNFRDLTSEADLEARFRATFEHAAVGLAQLNAEGRIVLANERLCAILGYARAELLGLSFRDISHPEDREVSAAQRARMYAGEIRQFTLRKRYLRKDGATVWMQVTAALVRSAGGGPRYEITAFEDVSEAVRIEAELKQSEGRFRALIENSADGIVLLDEAGRIRYGSPATTRILGYEESELVGREAVELVHADDVDSFRCDLAAVNRQPGGSLHAHARIRHKDGDYRLLEGTWTNLLGEPGVSALVANFRDVTERERSLQALAEAEERFRSLTELSADWYWEQDAGFRFTVVAGPGAVAMTNGSTAPYLGKTRWETPDLEPYEGDWRAHRAQLERHESFHDVVFRRRFADGTSGYMSVSGEPVFDLEGRFTGYRGVAKNVTDKVRAAQALRESEARFRSLTGLSSDWYWEQDADLRFVSTGGADKLRGGITAAQHEGLRRWELPGTEALSGSWDEHRAVLAARLPFRDFMLRRTGTDGAVHYISVSGEPVFGEGGAFRGYRGVAKDVTASHRAVLALRASEERFRNLSGLSSDWYWEQDAEFRFTRTSVDRGSPVFGDAAAPLGKARWELSVSPVSCTWEQHREALRAHRIFRDFEYSYAGEDGEPRYVSASGYPVFDESGRFTGYRGIARDITARKHAEQRMALHAERQEAIARFGQYALGRRTIDELYAEAARTLRGATVDAACALELMSDGTRYLVRAADGAGSQRTLGMVATISPDSLLPPTLRENAPRIIGEEFLAGRPVDGPGREWVHAMKSAVYIPVHAEDNPASVLSMYSIRPKAFGDGDVRFAEAVANVLSTALQRHRAEQRLAHLAQFDALTGLPNRTLLQDRFAQTLVQSQRRQVHAGVLFVDLDRFKLINDSLGHHLGDALIRQVGERLVACVRPGDTVGRISGDEFAVVLADLARPDDAAIVAQKALDALAKPFDLAGNEAYVTASIGIAAFPADGEDAETLLKSADMAMYRAKESARNSYCFFTAEMNQRSVAKVQLNTDLRRALERDEFTLHYQPKVDLASGKLRGMEALLRWNHPSRGLVSPGEFIPALEDSGLILPVGEWVVEEACRQVLRWTEGGSMPVPVAVNLSPKQFRRRDLDALIRAALVRTGVSAEFLELEITESCLMENPEDAVRELRNLRAAGLRISVDDFGTGYSSLSYLTRLPLSALKIDRSFVRDAESSAEAASIVRAVIDMAQNLRLTVIAEGVETEQQAAFLRRHGCDQAQGYFYGRPVPPAEITPRLARP
ncbi:MAG TPA: PAS domain S-box protein [Burkholderiales bacterium]|nr:PAS domain S-box protein [Burkholderiales bacterium]